MSLSAVFKYMAKQAVDCRNMVRVKVWHTHTTVWLLKNYRQRILTYCTRILLLDLTYGRTMVIRHLHLTKLPFPPFKCPVDLLFSVRPPRVRELDVVWVHLWAGLGCMDWVQKFRVGLGFKKATHVQLWAYPFHPISSHHSVPFHPFPSLSLRSHSLSFLALNIL